MSVPNKLIVTNHKDILPPFLQINLDDVWEAVQNLTHSAFILYLYIAKNADGHQMELSPMEIAKKKLMGRTSYYRALEELIGKGYIEGNNFYTSSRERRERIAQLKSESFSEKDL